MATDLETLIEQIKALPQEEQEQVREALTCVAPPPATVGKALTEEEVNRRLVEAGIIRERTSPIREPKEAQEAFEKYHPVPIRGKPLSETIIEERR